MITLIIDTCVWLNLAKEPNFYTIIEALKEIIDSNQFQLVLPSVLITEFERNCSGIEVPWKSDIKGYLTILNKLLKRLPSKEEELRVLIEETQKLEVKGIEEIKKNLDLIKLIFNNAINFEATDAMMIEASRRAINHIAPATNPQRSSIGDCLIWLTVLEMLKEGEVWFCTDNKKDFSSVRKPGREDIPNEILDKEAIQIANKKGCFNYFIDPGKLIEIATKRLKIVPKKYLPIYHNDNLFQDFLSQHPPIYNCSKCGSSKTSLFIRTLPEGWMKFVRCQECNNVNLVDMFESIE